MISTKRIASLAAAGILVICLAALAGPAMAQGFGGHGGRGGRMFLLARSAGITRSQIKQAFKADANIKTDFTNVRNAHQNVITCLVTPGSSCSSQITALASAQQALTQEKLTVWQGLFQGAGAANQQKAAKFLSDMQALQAQRRQVFQQDLGFGGPNDNNSPSQQ